MTRLPNLYHAEAEPIDPEIMVKRARAALGARLRRRRHGLALTQVEIAERLGTGQARVAKMEAAHPSVSIESVMRALLVLGESMAAVGAVMGSGDANVDVRRRRARRQKKREQRAARRERDERGTRPASQR